VSKILLFNHTKHDDKIIRKVLAYAARRMKVPGRTAVKVNPTRYLKAGATAYQGWAYKGFMKGWRNSKSKEFVGEFGFIEVGIPTRVSSVSNAESGAEWFLHLAEHEMGHIKDYRQGRFRQDDCGPGGRRPKHSKRPVEISAENHVYDARPKTKKEKEARARLVASVASMLEKTIPPTREEAARRILKFLEDNS